MSTVKMPVTERIYEYRVRREVSQTADLAALFLAPASLRGPREHAWIGAGTARTPRRWAA